MAIRKEFWRLAWPAAAEGLLLMLLTAADLLMVSSLGNTAVAAVSIFSQPRMVILCVTRSYSVALSAYVARRRGEDPDESLTACSRASLMLGCGLSILLLVGTWIGAGPLLQLAGAQDDYISLALRYAFPALVSLAFSGPAIVLHGILAGLGDTKSVLVSNVLPRSPLRVQATAMPANSKSYILWKVCRARPAASSCLSTQMSISTLYFLRYVKRKMNMANSRIMW